MSNRLAIGDVFEVPLDASVVGFIQYVARDVSQLNSQVVRVFRRRCREDVAPDVSEIVHGEIDFYAHVFLGAGIKQKFWRKVARADVVGEVNVLFRNSSDYGKSKHKTSNNWFVWRIDSPYIHVGALSGIYRNAEVGVVVPPDSLVHRMKNGSYDFFYPDPES
ncbi:hypothetical protein [Rhodanobacter sp. PCA2]|uniref:hypothetical protein n=1 Tax=Rhodanobacter sp. PCA2 TaxID=2006117 RepID=UPI0015E71F8E|nr:hypothetical protein [Rhodanobacter sp. PCA2]